MSYQFAMSDTEPTAVVPSTKERPKFKNRNRIEIISNILDIARNGALKTHLMYRANLSYMVVSQYLNFLSKSGLIEERLVDDGPTKLYRTSSKGFRYLEVYNNLQAIAGMESEKSIQSAASPSVLFS